MTANFGNIVLVGSRGKMAQYFKVKFAPFASEVRELARPLTPENVSAALGGAHIVMLCMHVDAIDETLRDHLAAYLEPDAILVDIASVKIVPQETMRKNFAGAVVGTHPLYGPRDAGVGEAQHRTIITAPTDTSEAAIEKIELLFRAIGDDTLRTTAEQHDRAMAQLHNLNFLSSVAFFAALDSPDELQNFLIPSFHRRMDASRISLTDDAEMFKKLVRLNPLTQDILGRYLRLLHQAGTPEKLDEMLCKAQVWYDCKFPL